MVYVRRNSPSLEKSKSRLLFVLLSAIKKCSFETRWPFFIRRSCFGKRSQVSVICLTVFVFCLFLSSNYFQRPPWKKCSHKPCTILAKDGSYKFRSGSVDPLWQPNGCDLRYRTLNENILCLYRLWKRKDGVNSITFAGDTRLRQLRDEFVYQITGEDTDTAANPGLKISEKDERKNAFRDDFFPGANVRVHFEWSPYIEFGQDSLTHFVQRLIDVPCWRPDILILGAGIWTSSDCAKGNRLQTECVAEYKRDFEILMNLLSQLPSSTNVIWFPQPNVNETTMTKHGHPFFKVGVNSSTVMIYNDVIKHVLASSPGHRVTYWEAFYTSSLQLADGLDGIHLGTSSKRNMMQLLMNYMCNQVDTETNFLPGLFSQQNSNEADICCAENS